MRYEAIYARQSVDKTDSISIESQIEICEKEAGKNYKVYSDKGYSRKKHRSSRTCKSDGMIYAWEK